MFPFFMPSLLNQNAVAISKDNTEHILGVGTQRRGLDLPSGRQKRGLDPKPAKWTCTFPPLLESFLKTSLPWSQILLLLCVVHPVKLALHKENLDTRPVLLQNQHLQTQKNPVCKRRKKNKNKHTAKIPEIQTPIQGFTSLPEQEIGLPGCSVSSFLSVAVCQGRQKDCFQHHAKIPRGLFSRACQASLQRSCEARQGAPRFPGSGGKPAQGQAECDPGVTGCLGVLGNGCKRKGKVPEAVGGTWHCVALSK